MWFLGLAFVPSVMFLSVIHVVERVLRSFLWWDDNLLCRHTAWSLCPRGFVSLLHGGYIFGWFGFGAHDNAAVSIRVQVFDQHRFSFLLCRYIGVEFAGLDGVLC